LFRYSSFGFRHFRTKQSHKVSPTVPVLDLILNLTALLLWLSWRAFTFDSLTQLSPATLMGTIRRAEPTRVRGWYYLLALALLLFLRAWFYWQIGPLADWTPSLRLGVVAPPFRSDFFSRALLYSIFSFGSILAVFYLCLLLLSAVNGNRQTDAGPFQKLVRLHLGWLDRWWWPVKLILPFLVVAAFWMALNPFLARSKIIPAPASMLHRLEQAATIGLGVYLNWQYLICVILLLYLLSTYVFLGTHPFWSFVGVTGGNLLRPLRILPLRIGKLDFAPFIAIALIFFGSEFARRELTTLYARLPI
jgi:uncharacterized protein YggT (Ycf19 family)